MLNTIRNLVSNTSKKQLGFSTLELLIAGTMTLGLGAIAITGVSSLIKGHNQVTYQIDKRLEASRALNFIETEVSTAQHIQSSNVNLNDVAPSFVAANIPGKVFLVIDIPGLDENVVYYTKQLPANSIWQGDRALYRFGPDFTSNGSYDISNWRENILIDNVKNNAIDYTCPINFEQIPATNPIGIVSCVSPNNKAVRVVLDSEYKPESNKQFENLMLANATKAAPIALVPNPLLSAEVANNPCEIVNGVLSCSETTTFNLEILGSGSHCGSSSAPFLVTTDILINGVSQGLALTVGQFHNVTIDPNDTVEVVSTKNGNQAYASWCHPDEVVNSTHPTRVLNLENGDEIPSEYTPLFGQGSIAEYLDGYVDGDTVSINDNQFIQLFELAYNPSGASNDMQDNVVLITIN